jgi:hypothetical protein
MSDLQKLVDALLLYLDAQENAISVLRYSLKEIAAETPQPQPETTINEDRFKGLAWRDENGAKLGAYQVALIQDNDEQAWRHAYNILQANGATISNRFHEQGYAFSYWLYDKMDYKIFRQKLKEASQ